LNKDIAYLHYFPPEKHPGYQPYDMNSDDCTGDIHFGQTDGSEGGSFDMPDYTLVSADTAYNAVIEFFRSSDLPQSISWFEL